MTKLKTILQSKYFYLILFLVLFVYILISTVIIKRDSNYHNSNNLKGKIIKITEKGDKISLIIKNKEKVLVDYYYQEHKPDLSIGDEIIVNGEEKTINNNTIPNTFNYRDYLYNQGIYLWFNAKNISVVSKSNNYINKIRSLIQKRIANNSYMNLFILGDKSLLENEIYKSYQTNGIAHLLAISGLHLSILVFLLNKILFFIRNNHRFILIVVFLLLYAYLIDFPPSFLRVLLFFVLSFVNQKLLLNINNIKLLFLTASILLLINPFYLYNTGFQFSFITVFGIMLCSKYLHYNYLINLLLVTIISFLFTLPIVVNLNYEINLLSFIVNLVLVPLVSFVIYPLALLNLFISIINPCFLIFINIMENISLFCSQIHITKIIIPRMPLILIVIYYLLLIYLIYHNRIKHLFILILLIIMNKYVVFLNHSYQITFFNVGQGDSSVIITPHYNDVIMIDTGGNVNNDYKLSDNILLYFKSIGLNKISTLVITHGDYDHMGESINIVQNFKVEKVIFNCGEFNELEQDLIKVLDKKKITYYSCISELNISNNKLHFLQTKEYDNENDNSNVIYTKIDGYKFLFMGDASITTEKEIIDKYNFPNIDVLKVGHHGSRTSSSKDFINEVNPKYSIFSVGKNNRYGHPNKEVLDTLENSKIYRTDQDGSIMFKIKNNKLKIETCSP